MLQDKARQLGVTSEDIAGALNGIVGGITITQVRDSIYLVDVVARARPAERQSIDTLLNLQLPGQSGQSVPLAAIATFSYEIEQPVVWRRSRRPDHHAARRHPRRHPARDHRPAARPGGRGLHREAACRLLGRRGRPGRGERQGAGADRGRGARSCCS